MIGSVLAVLIVGGCGGGGTSATAEVDDVEVPISAVATPHAAASIRPATSPSTATSAATSSGQPLAAFWSKFRTAALRKDQAAIAVLSAPVVTQNGILDDSPKHRLTPSKAAIVLLQMLDDPNVVDDKGRTNRQILEATPTAELDTEWSDERLRIGDLEFAHGTKGWRLDQFYYEP